MRGPERISPFIRALPRRALSRLTGQAARCPLPSGLLAPLLGVYARSYGADLGEMAAPLHTYRSFLDFFTRRLRTGLRPMPEDPRAVAAPADGRIHAAGPVEAGTILQTKGVPYHLADLLGDSGSTGPFVGGSYLTTYLAPGDYHRFHWPFAARVEHVRHIPGDLWPVHPGAARTVPRLFARNERVVLRGQVREGGGAFAAVPVGALNVGSIRLAGVPVRTNRGGSAQAREVPVAPFETRRGDEMGWFEMGSALVLVLAADAGRLDPLEAGSRVRVGMTVGRL